VSAAERADAELVVVAETLFVDRLTIAEAEDWVVHDVRTKGGSIFVQMGDLPGELFSGDARVLLVPLAAGDRVEIEATYVGKKEATQLRFEISGTRETARTPRETSYFLPMSTGVPVLPTQTAQITGRPQRSFVADRVVVATPDAWVVNEVRVGNRSQLVQGGDIPALAFASRAAGCRVIMDAVQTRMDFVVVATYAGSQDGGECFCCGVQGRLA